MSTFFGGEQFSELRVLTVDVTITTSGSTPEQVLYTVPSGYHAYIESYGYVEGGFFGSPGAAFVIRYDQGVRAPALPTLSEFTRTLGPAVAFPSVQSPFGLIITSGDDILIRITSNGSQNHRVRVKCVLKIYKNP